ncbi:MAG: hypothetical protein KatS3mg018_0573 [Fimbriimonadales bacterium]|jgi:hypothetical protein|nr:MAG: hypothetical protein KatS3mg018_0573 [Fimbriimonadales bacterium]
MHRWIIRLIKPALIRWLDERALRLPAARKHDLARQLKLSEQTIDDIESALRRWAIEQIESL